MFLKKRAKNRIIYYNKAMKKFKFVLARLFDMDYERMFKTVGRIHEKSGKNRILIFLDMIYCGFRYQAGYVDYELFQMYDLNRAQRLNVWTRGKDDQLVGKYNKREFRHFFSNKDEFNEKFKDFIKREFLVIDGNNLEAFKEFIKDKEEIIAKPIDGTHGDGVSKLKTKDLDYQTLCEKGRILLEEVVIQDKRMDALNPSSVNTLRIMTFFDLEKDEVFVPAAFLRIGNGAIVDNFNGGGMATKIDLEKGICAFKAVDRNYITYEYHPLTNKRILGFKIPDFDEALKLVKKAARVIPEVQFIAWDVAISNKGPCLIEGNDYPGHDLCGMPEFYKADQSGGMLPELKKYMSL